MTEQIPVIGDKNEIVLEKNKLINVKAIINTFCEKTEAGITDIINNNFSSLSASDKAIIRELALAVRANSIAIKYMWAIMK